MEKFIAALDLQDHTVLVLQKAAEIAQKFEAQLHIVHVVPAMGNYIGATFTDPLGGIDTTLLPSERDLMESQRQAAQEHIEKLIQSLSLHPNAVKIFEGDIEYEILHYAREIQAGMIIMGTHQHSGLVRLFSRETSVKMLHETQIPILVIPVKEAPY